MYFVGGYKIPHILNVDSDAVTSRGRIMIRSLRLVLAIVVTTLVFSPLANAQQPNKDSLTRTLRTGLESSKQRALDQLEGLGDDPMVLEILLTVLKKDSRTSSNDSKFRMLQMMG